MVIDYKDISSPSLTVTDSMLEFTGSHFDIPYDFEIVSESRDLEIKFPYLRNKSKDTWNPDVKIVVSGPLNMKLVNPLPCKLRYRGMETSTFREGSVSFTYPEYARLYSDPRAGYGGHYGYDPDTSKIYTYDSFPLLDFDIPKHDPSLETMVKLMFDNFGRSGVCTMPNEAHGRNSHRHKWSISSIPVFK